jgi:mannan endo-1,4-beta-mannosidase
MQIARQSPSSSQRSRGALALAGVVAVALLLAAAPAQATSTHRPHAGGRSAKRPLEPRPMYWGASIGDQLTGTQPPWDMSALAKFESLVGKGLSLVALNSPFEDCSGPCTTFPFPAQMMENIRTYGAIPFFNWSSQLIPADPTNSSSMPGYQLSDMISGRYDGYIREFAEAARNWGHSFFLRFDWEMNGNWFPWGAGVNGNGPGEFVAAWRHVHDIFTAVGATNATWVWCPYAEVERRFAPLKPLYPGNRYVDWTCMDGFNWAGNPTNPHPWRSFSQIFETTYRQLTQQIAPSKPVVLAEMASTGSSRAKAAWIRDMFKQLGTRFRRIRGLIWFDQVDRGINWPLETSPAATAAFARGIRNRAFASNSFHTSTGGPVRPPR